MHAYLIVGKIEKDIENKVSELTKKHRVELFKYPLTLINDVRELNSFTKLTLSKPTAILIENIDNATKQAQSAFLKNLEEPQTNLIYILTAKSSYNLLPTITSRCQLITTKKIFQFTKPQVLSAKKFIGMTKGERLLFIYNISKRESAKNFIEDLIIGSHYLFTKEKKIILSAFLKAAESTRKSLIANGNVNLQLTNFVINLDTN